MGFWSPIGDSPSGNLLPTFWELVTKRSPIGDQKHFGDAHTPFSLSLTLLF